MTRSNLVLTLRAGESVDIDGPCRVTLLDNTAVRVSIEAERSVNILRANARNRSPAIVDAPVSTVIGKTSAVKGGEPCAATATGRKGPRRQVMAADNNKVCQ